MSRVYSNQQKEYGTSRIYGAQVSEDERKADRNREFQAQIDSMQDFSQPTQTAVPQRRGALQAYQESGMGQAIGNWKQSTRDDFSALFSGEITITDVVKQMPRSTVKVGDAIADVVIPGIRNFVVTTGSIFGEGLAYALDKNVREQYLAGNTDILPTITETTPKKLALYTVAAGIETAIIAKLPSVVGKSMWKRAAIGGIDGMGFAISEGIAKDRSAEEIVKTMPLYGIAGSTIAILTPYLIPLIKRELSQVPDGMRAMFKGLYEEVVPPTRQINITDLSPDPVRIPVSTPNTRYQDYLRRMGYEPYIPDEALPTIEFGERASRVTDDMIDVDVPLTRQPDTIPTRTAELNPQQQEVFVRESNRLIDEGFGPREAQNRALALATNDIRGAEMVPEPRFRDVSNSVQGEAITSAPARQTEEIVTSVEARQAATDRVVPDQIQVEPVEVPMPVEVRQASLPVGDGEKKVSRFAADVLADVDNVRKFTPDIAEKLGIPAYNSADYTQQIMMGTRLVETDLDLALRVARGEVTIPGMLNNAPIRALVKKAEKDTNARLALEVASLQATRFGQEIGILRRNLDGSFMNNPIDILSDILDLQKARYGASTFSRRKNWRENFNEKKKPVVKQIEKTLDNSEIKISRAMEIVNKLEC